MGKYKLELKTKENKSTVLGGIETLRIPMVGEIIPFRLDEETFKDWYKKYLSFTRTGEEIPKEEIESFYNDFNGKNYVVKDVKHRLVPKKYPHSGILETSLLVIAKEQE